MTWWSLTFSRTETFLILTATSNEGYRWWEISHRRRCEAMKRPGRLCYWYARERREEQIDCGGQESHRKRQRIDRLPWRREGETDEDVWLHAAWEGPAWRSCCIHRRHTHTHTHTHTHHSCSNAWKHKHHVQTTQTKNGLGSKKREICVRGDHRLQRARGGWMMKSQPDKFLFHQTAAEVWDQDATWNIRELLVILSNGVW